MRVVYRCWVCFKPLGPSTAAKPGVAYTCSVVRDPTGQTHYTHTVCAKDADGKYVCDTKLVPLEE